MMQAVAVLCPMGEVPGRFCGRVHVTAKFPARERRAVHVQRLCPTPAQRNHATLR